MSPYLLVFAAFFAAVSSAPTSIYYSTFDDGSDFTYSTGYVAITMGDSNCMGDGYCARMSATNPAAYLQTTSGIVSTVGYTDISVVLKLTVTSWAYGSLLTIAWKPDGSMPGYTTIATYVVDELTQNTLLTLGYSLDSSAENMADFAIYITAYHDASGMGLSVIPMLVL